MSENSYKIPKKTKPKIDLNELMSDENDFEEFKVEEWSVDNQDVNHWDDKWDQSSDVVKQTPEDQELKDLCLKTLNEVNNTLVFDSLVLLLGQILVLTLISWKITKQFRKLRNKELISSFKRAVVVTGCDTGFGNGLAHKLNEHGFRVYATVLDPESTGAKNLIIGARFEGKTKVMRMDVTNDEEVNE